MPSLLVLASHGSVLALHDIHRPSQNDDCKCARQSGVELSMCFGAWWLQAVAVMWLMSHEAKGSTCTRKHLIRNIQCTTTALTTPPLTDMSMEYFPAFSLTPPVP